jgi:hypothetical protein
MADAAARRRKDIEQQRCEVVARGAAPHPPTHPPHHHTPHHHTTNTHTHPRALRLWITDYGGGGRGRSAQQATWMEQRKLAQEQPRATLSFYTAVDRHWLPFLRESHDNLAIVAVMSSQADNVAPGWRRSASRWSAS